MTDMYCVKCNYKREYSDITDKEQHKCPRTSHERE